MLMRCFNNINIQIIFNFILVTNQKHYPLKVVEILPQLQLALMDLLLFLLTKV